MEPSPAAGLGPPPFVFEPSEPVVRGPAFSVSFKALATVMVAGSVGWAVRLWLQGKLGTQLTAGHGWFAAALVMMLWTWWAVVRSITSVDATELRQTWVWTKRMPLRDLAYARLVRVPGLDWLIAPRLYTRTLLGKMAVFYIADARLAAECERLVKELAAFRISQR